MYFPAFLADHFPFVRRGESFDPEEDFSCVYGGARPRAFLSKFLPRRREKAWPGSGNWGKDLVLLIIQLLEYPIPPAPVYLSYKVDILW